MLRQVEMLKYEGQNKPEIKQDFSKIKAAKDSEYYLYAEKAKLVYHSVHDTSILFLLEAMNISNGREPMFAEMLTLEIYERSESDPWYNKNIEQETNELYANYLFRWTRKGLPLTPFPGCEAEAEYTKSNLCSLSVLMDAIEYGQNIKEWETTCQQVTNAYFQKKNKKKKDKIKKSKDGSLISYLWTFLFGVSVGVALMMFLSKYNSWFNSEWKYESI